MTKHLLAAALLALPVIIPLCAIAIIHLIRSLTFTN